MADFTTANLPGANEKFNTVRGKFTSLKTSLKSNMEVDASSLSSTLKTDITSFADELKKLIPELPDLPDISLQASLTSFIELSGESANKALASIKSRFGDGVGDLGFDLDELVAQAQDAVGKGESIASKIPNITIPEGGGVAKLLPNNVKQADIETIEELLSEKVNVEVTEEIKKVTVESVQKNKTLVSPEPSLEPAGYIVKEDTSKDTVDTVSLSPAINLTPAQRMGLTDAEYQRHKQLQKETQALTKELKEDPTFSVSDERKGIPTGGDEDLKERREKRINELNAIRSKGKVRLRESNRLQAEGFSEAAALDATGIRPASASELLRS